MSLPKIAIIILNWNGKKYLQGCLTAVHNQTHTKFEVILVDNGSTDNSIKYVREHFPEVEIVQLDKNYGFARGNNMGIEKALEDKEVKHIALLNNDTHATENWLTELVSKAEEEDDIGMVASKLIYAYSGNIINSAGTIITKDGSGAHLGGKEIDRGQYDDIYETFAPCAAAALYRRSMLEEIGFFDEDFFAYLEDLDLAWRAHLMGWKCVLAPRALVYHVHSATTGKYSEFKVFQIERNRIWILIKNYPLHYSLLSPFYTAYKLILMYKWSKSKGTEVSQYSENIPFWRIVLVVLGAWMQATSKLPRFIRKRIRIQRSKKASQSQIDEWFARFSKPLSQVVSR